MKKNISKSLIEELKNNWLEYFILIIVLFIAYIYQLGAANIRTWDEGVYGSNVLEMLYRKEFLIKYFDGHPETWATIPPLIAWFQTLSLALFGISEFTFRLPSAISALIISISIFYFLYKEFENKYWGMFSALILAFSNGFVTYHVARTGDLDVFVAMFSTLYILYFYKFYKSDFDNRRFAFLFILFVFCSFWTKLVAGFFYLPVLFFFILFSGKSKSFFTNKWIYFYSIILLMLTVAYYIYMEFNVPGYTKIAIHNGIIGRFTGKLSDNHLEPFWYYWENIKSNNFLPWLYILPFSIYLLFLDRNIERKRFLILLISLVLFYWLVISTSANKLQWYDGQLFPLLSILAAYPLSILFNSVISLYKTSNILRQLMFLVFFIALMGINLKDREEKNLSERHMYNFDEMYGTVLKEIHKKNPEIKTIKILHPFVSPHVTFYKTLYNLYYNFHITDELIADYIDIKPQTYILYGHPAVTEKLKKFFDYDIIYEYRDIKLVFVKRQIRFIYSEYTLDGDSLAQNSSTVSKEFKTTGNASIKINKSNPYSDGWSFSLIDLKHELYSKFHITADFLVKDNIFDCYLVIESNELNYWCGINLKNISNETGIWNRVDTIINFPQFEDWQNPNIKIYFWNNKEHDLYIDNINLKLIK